jgi:hypothetical protein
MKLLTSAIAVLFAISCTVKPTLEIEPNNRFLQAQKVSLPSIILGSTSSSTDSDLYLLNIQENTFITCNVRPDGVSDILLSLINKKHSYVKIINDSGPGKIEECPVLYIPAGIWYLEIKTITKELPVPVPYTLTIKVLKNDIFETEPNDTFLTAGVLQENSLVKGYFGQAYNTLQDDGFFEKDWYKIVSQPGETKHIHFFLSGVPYIDSVLEIYNYKKTLIKRYDSGKEGEGESARFLRFDAPTEMYISISSKNRNKDTDIPYQLFAETMVLNNNKETEPNNSFFSASKLQHETQELEGIIENTNDIDIFKLMHNYNEQKLQTIMLYPPSKKTLNMELYNEHGSLLTKAFSIHDDILIIEHILVFKENLYLKIYPASNTVISENPYRIKKIFQNFEPGMETEPNNTREKSMIIKPGNMYSCSFSHNLDTDTYSVTITDANIYTLTYLGPQDTSCIMTIENENKNFLQTFAVTSSSTNVPMEILPGTYFIIFKPQTLSHSKGYQFSVSL